MIKGGIRLEMYATFFVPRARRSKFAGQLGKRWKHY